MPPKRVIALAFLIACQALSELDLEPTPRDCETRVGYWLDADGDGVGGDAEVYVGCAAIDGYVEATGDCDDGDSGITDACDTAADSGDTSDADTGDTDTGEADTDTGDTGDTDTGDTDTGDTDTGDSG